MCSCNTVWLEIAKTRHLFLFNYCKSGVQRTAHFNSTGRTWTQRAIIRCSAVSVFFAGESRTVVMGDGDCWTCFSGRTIFIRQGGLLRAKSSVSQRFHCAFVCLLLTFLDVATLSFRKRKRSRAPRGQSATPRLVLNRLACLDALVPSVTVGPRYGTGRKICSQVKCVGQSAPCMCECAWLPPLEA